MSLRRLRARFCSRRVPARQERWRSPTGTELHEVRTGSSLRAPRRGSPGAAREGWAIVSPATCRVPPNAESRLVAASDATLLRVAREKQPHDTSQIQESHGLRDRQ